MCLYIKINNNHMYSLSIISIALFTTEGLFHLNSLTFSIKNNAIKTFLVVSFIWLDLTKVSVLFSDKFKQNNPSIIIPVVISVLMLMLFACNKNWYSSIQLCSTITDIQSCMTQLSSLLMGEQHCLYVTPDWLFCLEWPFSTYYSSSSSLTYAKGK